MKTDPDILPFFDETTNTVTYLVSDPATNQAAVVDPVLDYDHASGDTSAKSADRILQTASQAGLKIIWALETHAHADHLSAASYIKQRTGAQIAIGAQIREVQTIFRPIFNLDDVSEDGSEFDRLLIDGEMLMIGSMPVEILHTPGHTPACVSYRIGNTVFVGDTLFMPDYGTARADFPGGCAKTLFCSIRRLLSLPPDTRLLMCHDYKAPGRSNYAWECTVEEARKHNIHVHDQVTEQEFVTMRQERDKTLRTPSLLLPSVQVNIRAGRFPKAESNGVVYLKVPVRLMREASI
ncbi:MBL fold metallo-hydrolase [Pusillimonas sp. MFBS29]|uniref:MBL fold metallo-hydrolase n=1 Tax=Pusillimonas sp. MFBS29 TaxID=2886690 RepID=UPI001D0FE18C|nr:MBL fold metallo-hydrolase [Pusillimonas sp. MFBS29]MCC2595879.1 MBL fold metallo-hydrolase [Pusillimonas sp. MFBS29]